MDERSAVLNYQSTFAMDLALLLDTNVDVTEFRSSFPGFSVPDDFKSSLEILETFSIVKITNISVPRHIPKTIKVGSHFSILWPDAVANLPVSSLSDAAHLEKAAQELYISVLLHIQNALDGVTALIFHMPALLLILLISFVRRRSHSKWPRGFVTMQSCFFVTSASLLVQVQNTSDPKAMFSCLHSVLGCVRHTSFVLQIPKFRLSFCIFHFSGTELC